MATTLFVLIQNDCRQQRWQRIPLFFLPHLSNEYQETLSTRRGALLDEELFRELRDRCGAWIETDEPARVRTALGLGLPEDEPGLVIK